MKNTPENRKIRTGKDFTIRNEALNLGKINENLKEYHSILKNTLKFDLENVEIKKLVDYFTVYFEEN